MNQIPDPSARVTLRKAVDRYKAEPGAPSNTYEWYRKIARETGRVWIGGDRIPATKIGNQWFVELADLDAALDAHRDERARIARTTAEYEAQVLHADGVQKTTWGHYSVSGDFHFCFNSYAAARHRSDGSWYCNTCFKPAATEHDHPECHRCRDWGSCGNDCTLSAVFCSAPVSLCRLRLPIRVEGKSAV